MNTIPLDLKIGNFFQIFARFSKTTTTSKNNLKKPPTSMKMQAISIPTNLQDLPQCFNVRYLGFRGAEGLWGIKFTRKPVDTMVTSVKARENSLHLIKFIVTKDGCKLESIYNGKIETRFFPIETISYGVQDLVYTRVFAMIIVREKDECSTSSTVQCSFECHAFVCDSRQSARKLTYSLATAFQEYSKRLKLTRKQFAIDLRTPEEIGTEPKYRDSEA